MNSHKSLRSFLVISGTALLSFSSVQAATLIWDTDNGTGGAQDGGGDWTVGSLIFWDGAINVATNNNIFTDIALFGNAGTGGTVNVSTQSINGLVFDTTTTTGYTLTASSAGQMLTIGSGGVTVNAGALATSLGSANLGITFAGSQTWANNSANTLTLGTITRGAGGTINFTGTGTIAIGNTNTNGILGAWATVNGTDWATKSGSNVAAFTTYTLSTAALGTNNNIDVVDSGKGANSTVNSLRFNDATAGRNFGSNANNPFTLTSGGILVTSNANNDANITSTYLNSASDLIVHQYNTTFTINAGILNKDTAIGFTKSGLSGSTLVLTGPSGFSGNAFINAGTVQLSGVNGLWGAPTNTSNAFLGNGAIANYAGTITNNGTFRFSSTTDQMLSGVMSGTGALTKDTGSSVLTLTADNTYTGATTVSAGTLAIGNGGTTGSISPSSAITNTATLRFNRSDTITQGTHFGAINGTAGILVQAGIGTLVLNTTNGYTGATTVNAGTLRLDLATGSISSSSALSLGGGNFTLRGNSSGTSSQTLGALTIQGNTNSAITLDANGGSGTTLTLASSSPTRTAGGTVLFDLSGGNATLSSTLGLTAAAQTTTQGILGYALVKDSTGTGFATNVGGSIVRYTGAATLANNSATATTTNYVTSGNLTLDASLTPTYNSLSIDASSAGVLDLNGNTVSLSQRALLVTGNNNYTIQGGTLAGSGHEMIVHQTGSGILTISSNISGGAGSLTKTGAGTLTLTGTNAYTGGIVLSGGTLNLNNAMTFTGGVTINSGELKLGNGGAVNSLIGSTTITGSTATNAITFGSGSTGILTLNGNSVAITSLSTNAVAPGAAIIQNASATNATLTVGNNSNSTFAGVIQDGTGGGILSLNKIGTGNLIFTKAQTYTGTTTISANNNTGTTIGGLTLSGEGTLAGNVVLNGGLLHLINNSADIGRNRIGDTASITSSGGAIYMKNAWGGGLNYSETVGSTVLNGGNTGFYIAGTTAGGSQTFNMGAFSRSNYATADFSANTSVTFSATSGISSNLTATNSVVGPWATYTNGNTVNSYVTTDATGRIIEYTGNQVNSATGSTWAGNVTQITTDTTIASATRSVNTLKLKSGATALTMNAGGVLETYGLLGAGSTIAAGTGGTITIPNVLDAANAIYLNAGNGGLTVNAAITDNGAAKLTLVATASGSSVTIGSSLNSYTGGTVISSPNNFNVFQGGRGGFVILATGATLGSTSNFLDIQSGTLNLGANTVSVGDFRGGFASTLTGTGTLTIGTGNNGGGNFQGLISSTMNVVKTGTNTITLSGTDARTGASAYTINGGTLQFAKTSALFNTTTASWTAAKIVVGNGATLGINVGGAGEFNQTNVGTLLTNLGGANGTGTTGFAAGSSIGIDTTNASGGSFTITSVIANSSGTGGGAIGFKKLGTGSLVLNNTTNTFTGQTTISGGTLALTGTASISNSSGIQISGSTTLDVTGLTGNFTLGSAQTLSGNGTILATGKTVTVNGTVSAGNSPGTLTQNGGTYQLGADGNMNMQIHNSIGVAGVGYDTVNLINGAVLDLSLLSTLNTYDINLWSLSGIGPDVNGDAINFDNSQNYTWTLISTGTAITGFNTNLFTINVNAINGTNGFTNSLGGGTFSVGLADGNTDLVVNFTAIPEPRVILLSCLGILLVLRRKR